MFFRSKYEIDYTMTLCQRSLESKLELMGVVLDESEKDEIKTHIKHLNKQFPRVAKDRRFVVSVYKSILWGLLRTESECYYVEAYSQRAAVNKVLKRLK